MTFAPGQVIAKREVWDGATWLEHPVTVESDDDDGEGGVLAAVLDDGAAFTFPDHPGLPHPWSHHDAWRGPTVLQLRRAGDWYSVWLFFAPGLTHWYVNFERPYERTSDGIDTDDLELDLVVTPDGERRWKDVEHLAARLDERRFGVEELLAVLRAAAEVSDLLDRDERWWAPWDSWRPGERRGMGESPA